eukprot:365367-Chlamydomonas_euryale.AAC.3
MASCEMVICDSGFMQWCAAQSWLHARVRCGDRRHARLQAAAVHPCTCKCTSAHIDNGRHEGSPSSNAKAGSPLGKPARMMAPLSGDSATYSRTPKCAGQQNTNASAQAANAAALTANTNAPAPDDLDNHDKAITA